MGHQGNHKKKSKCPHAIYAIQHNITKKIYVGETSNVDQRLYQHMVQIKKGKHENNYLDKDIKEYGADVSFFILEENVPYENRLEREAFWMNKLKSNTVEHGYNFNHLGQKQKVTFTIEPGLPDIDT